MRPGVQRWLPIVLVLCAFNVGAATELAAQGARPATSSEPSLYARLGAYDGIAGFVDLAFPRVAAHPKLHRLFQGHSHDSQLRQRQLIVDMLCSATGGPCIYTGREMKGVHTGLGITADDWQAFIAIIGAALEERRVAPRERSELLRIFETRFRPDVVEGR